MIDLGQYEAVAEKSALSQQAQEDVFKAHKKRMAALLAELEAEEKSQKNSQAI